MNGASTEEIIDVVEQCPSAALTFYWNDTYKNQQAQSPKIFRGNLSELFEEVDNTPAASCSRTEKENLKGTTITISSGGPMIVEGNFHLADANGDPILSRVAKKIALCRCGLSETEPFCDGAHFKAGFNK